MSKELQSLSRVSICTKVYPIWKHHISKNIHQYRDNPRLYLPFLTPATDSSCVVSLSRFWDHYINLGYFNCLVSSVSNDRAAITVVDMNFQHKLHQLILIQF